MTDDKPTLTRRRVLGGMATIGAAGVLGSNTGAFFSDEEGSSGNVLTAGELDLALSWNKSYHGAEGDSYTDESGSPGDNAGPIFDLGDVKPGDWGEATITLDITDNPANVSLTGTQVSSAENGRNEPEREVDSDDDGELNTAIMAQMWYDANCDNDIDGGGEPEGPPLEVALVNDVSGSMQGSKLSTLKSAANDFVDLLAGTDEGASVSFSDSASVDQELTTNYSAVKNAINSLSADGQTNMADGISTAEAELTGGSNATSGADKVMVLLSDGEPTAGGGYYQSDEDAAADAADTAKGNDIRILTIGLELEADGENFLKNRIASSDSDAYNADTADLSGVYSTIATQIGTGGSGEQVFTSGTLAQVLSALDDFALKGDECYSTGSHCVGFEWWLPEDVGNEVQSDSVEFDLTFNAEQCRHNPANRPNHDDVPSNGQSSGTTTQPSGTTTS